VYSNPFALENNAQRFLRLDPLMAQFPWMSPYVAFDNNPVFYVDPLGLAAEGGPGDKEKRAEKKTKELPEVIVTANRLPSQAGIIGLIRKVWSGAKKINRDLNRRVTRMGRNLDKRDMLEAALSAVDAVIDYYSTNRKTIVTEKTNCDYREKYNTEVKPNLKPEHYYEPQNQYDTEAITEAKKGGGIPIQEYSRDGQIFEKNSVTSYDANGKLMSEVHYEKNTKTGERINYKYIDIDARKTNNKFKADFKSKLRKINNQEIDVKLSQEKLNKKEIQKKLKDFYKKNPTYRRR
jgi:hypothetical protein